MQPLVSFVLLTYNQSRTIQDALNSLLEQTYSPLEIIISDDHSTDDTWKKIQECISTYSGPHRLQLNQNHENIGINANYNRAFSLATGELILIAAGDDISLPERAAVTVAHWLLADKKPRLIATPVIDMHSDGALGEVIEVSDLARVHSLSDWFSIKPYVIGAGHAWHRSLFRDFSPLPVLLNHEDQIASYRAALLDAGMTLKIPLVKYRRGGATKRIRIRSSQEWLRKRRIDAMRDVEFWKQLAKDSASFSIDADDQRKVMRHLARCNFEFNMIDTTGLISQLKLLLTHPETDILFRLRTFFSVRFSEILFKVKEWKSRN